MAENRDKEKIIMKIYIKTLSQSDPFQLFRATVIFNEERIQWTVTKDLDNIINRLSKMIRQIVQFENSKIKKSTERNLILNDLSHLNELTRTREQNMHVYKLEDETSTYSVQIPDKEMFTRKTDFGEDLGKDILSWINLATTAFSDNSALTCMSKRPQTWLLLLITETYIQFLQPIWSQTISSRVTKELFIKQKLQRLNNILSNLVEITIDSMDIDLLIHDIHTIKTQ